MRRTLLMICCLAALVLVLGCGSETVTSPTYTAPQLLHVVYISDPDTIDARTLHVVHYNFSWQTDQPTTDVLFYGPEGDQLIDSLVAGNVGGSGTSGASVYHIAPPTGAPRFSVATGAVFFYRVRMRAVEPAAPAGYSNLYRVRAPSPETGKPAEFSVWRGAETR